MIGVFDSGFGGLTIFKEIEKRLSQYDYIYLGDNARTPYGNHSQKVIYEYTKQAIDYLFNQGCSLIILACNTASAEALPKIQQEYLKYYYPGKNVLGVIRPLAEEAIKITKNGNIGVIGTRSTIESASYIKELKEQDKDINVIQKACPLLVPLIEESYENEPETKSILEKYLKTLKESNIDTVILGCTHYGWLQNLIQELLGKDINVMDSGKVVAFKLEEYLKKHKEIVKEGDGKRIFLTTDSDRKFNKAAKKFLGRDIKSKIINITI